VSFTVRLDAVSKNFLTLLAASENETLEEYAQGILLEHSREAASDDAIMATLGRALLRDRAEKPEPKPEAKPEPKPEAKPKPAPCKSDGLPVGMVRCADGKVMRTRELRAQTLSAHEAGAYLGVSRALVARCVKERGVIPYGYVNNSKRMPRFRDVEVAAINQWLLTPCPKGVSPRTKKCPKCSRYFSAPGMRLHDKTCTGAPTL
tara:strand:- start:1242 stop:1856 length:615 start_codon:yes stop_codon:yes gene_type:complete